MKTTTKEMTFVEKCYADAVKRGNIRRIVRFGNMITEPGMPFKKHGNSVLIGDNMHSMQSLLSWVLEYEKGYNG